MGARHDPTSEKGLSQETVPPLENQQLAYHTKQMVWWISLNSALVGAEYVSESKMFRHREIQTSGRRKHRLQKHGFPDLDFGRLSTPPKWCDYTPLVLSFTQAHLCYTPFYNVSCDKCAIPHENKHEIFCDTIATNVSRYMKKYRCWSSEVTFGLTLFPGVFMDF